MAISEQVPPRPSWLKRLFGQEDSKPRAPDGTRIYAIGDVHGRRDLLEALLDKVKANADRAPSARNVLILVGDYVDRGKDSKGVIDLLLALDLPGWQTVYLRGNHDQAVLDFLNDANFYGVWRNYGAPETLLSYGVTPPRFEDGAAFAKAREEFAAKLPAEHFKFLNNLPYTHEEGDYLFVHAGIRPGIAFDQQVAQDLLMIRDDFLLSRQPFGKVIVHGHTPTDSPVKRFNRIGIDTGAFATGCLTAAIFENESCAFLSTGAPPRMTT